MSHAFKIDEHLPIEVAELCRARGFAAATIYEQEMGGADDPRVIDVCQSEKRALISMDLDFADLRTYPPNKYYGLIVLRLGRQDKHHILHVVPSIFPLLETEPLAGQLWIVDESSVRIRSS